MHRHSELRITLCIAGYVVVLMMVCALSSPLFDRTATDSSVFVAMGRAMLNGKVVYKDVFDHKGLYLYFLNAFAVLMTGKSLLGLFVVECVFMFLCARIVYAMLSKYTDRITAFLAMQIFMMIVMRRTIFEGGNLTEEYSLLFHVCAIYLVVRDEGRHSCLMMMLQGVLAGITLCFRPNMMMMWGGIALVSGVDMLRKKRFMLLLGNIAAGLAGLVISLLPAVIYAVLNDSVNDTLFGMFGYNFVYISGAAPFLKRAASVMIHADKFLLLSLILSAIIMFNKSPYYWAMLAFSAASVCISGRTYGHYYICLAVFMLPFAYEAALRIPKNKYKFMIPAVMVITVLLGFRPPEFVRAFFGREVIPPDEYIRCNEPYYSEHERVLVTRNDVRLYNVLGVIPQEKYFYVPSNSYEAFPEPVDSQISSILSGVNDVIIIKYRKEEHEIYPESGRSEEIAAYLAENYDLLYRDESNNTAMYGRK